MVLLILISGMLSARLGIWEFYPGVTTDGNDLMTTANTTDGEGRQKYGGTTVQALGV